MLTSYLGTNLLKHKNCSGSRTGIWVPNYKIRYIFILFFAWMNYVSGSVIMVLINQIISVITAVFLVFSCLLLPTVFSSSFLSKLLIQIAETIWRSILLSSLCPFPW